MLNVSTTTVSNVIHGKTKEVSPANVERIRKVLDEYDYMPTSMPATWQATALRSSVWW